MRITGVIKETSSHAAYRKIDAINHSEGRSLKVNVLHVLTDSVTVEFLDVDKPGTIEKIASWFGETKQPPFLDGSLLLYSYHESDVLPSEKTGYCQDPRHDKPCKLPCAACEAECHQPDGTEETQPYAGSPESELPKPLIAGETTQLPCGTAINVCSIYGDQQKMVVFSIDTIDSHNTLIRRNNGLFELRVRTPAIEPLRQLLDRLEATFK